MRIVSIDDFGIGPTANRRTLVLAREKKVDRVAVMAHGSVSHEEVQQLLASGVALDIHLDVDEAISSKRKIKESAFVQAVRFGFWFLLGKWSTRHVEKKWEKQLQKFFVLFGRYPDGLNTHRHVHFFPPFFRIMVCLAKKYNIPFVRLGRRGYGCMCMTAIILNVLRLWNRRILRREPILETSDRMASADWILPRDVRECPAITKREESVEIVFHPERDEEFECLKRVTREE